MRRNSELGFQVGVAKLHSSLVKKKKLEEKLRKRKIFC
jgi:hypothetical protein